ncbi:MAG: proteasome assembly chaperone family protein [Candidatus Methanomethylophilaceae archaeon]|nr:proteasome assembly chaperone family protein [Candidatus Methanomethylophilaceae archaeon]
MESVISFYEEPELRKPVLIEGLPGVGNVGKIVADFLAEKLDAKHFGTVISKHFPPQVLINGEGVGVMASNELFYVKDVGESHLDVIFLLGDFQAATAEGQFLVCNDLMNEVFLRYDVSTVFTLGGYGTGKMVDDAAVLGAATDVETRDKLAPYGVTFRPGEPAGGIVGASAVLLGLAQFHNIEGACIMGETSGYLVDYKSASKVLDVMERLLGTQLDRSEFNEKCQQVDFIAGKVKELENSRSGDSLGYIG